MLDGTLSLIELKQAQGEMMAASEALDRVQQILANSTRAQVSSQVAAQQAQLWLAQDNLAAALRWASEQEALISGDVHYVRIPEYLALARVLIAQGRRQPGGRKQAGGSHLTEVSNLLTRLLEKAEAAGWTGAAIVILALQAVAFQARGETHQALLALDRALSLGEPDGYIRDIMNMAKHSVAGRYPLRPRICAPQPIAGPARWVREIECLPG